MQCAFSSKQYCGTSATKVRKTAFTDSPRVWEVGDISVFSTISKQHCEECEMKNGDYEMWSHSEEERLIHWQRWGTYIPLWAWSCFLENSAEYAKCSRVSQCGRTKIAAAQQHKYHQIYRPLECKSPRNVSISASKYTSWESYLVLRQSFAALFVLSARGSALPRHDLVPYLRRSTPF